MLDLINELDQWLDKIWQDAILVLGNTLSSAHIICKYKMASSTPEKGLVSCLLVRQIRAYERQWNGIFYQGNDLDTISVTLKY
jgi:hypothetical protein